MADVARYSLPHSFGERAALAISEEIAALPIRPEYEIDFTNAQQFEPFGMLVVGAAVRRLKRRVASGTVNPTVRITGVDFTKQGHQYAKVARFWESLDSCVLSPKDSLGRPFIPVSCLERAELWREAGMRDPVRSGLIDEVARRLASVIRLDRETEVALSFAFAELFRNVLEHSRSGTIWYSAASRPSKGDIQVAILDEGRGIRKALEEDGNYAFKDDVSAIRESLKPGVSGRKGRKKSPEYMEQLLEEYSPEVIAMYDNYGLGLTLCTELFRRVGKCLIVSGTSALYLQNASEIQVSTNLSGTALRFVLDKQRVPGVLDKIKAELASSVSSTAFFSRSMQVRLGLRAT